jgi:nicotinic acid mononucleotide adenylyltransferase
MTNDNLDIVLNPSELSEAASQTAVVTFGRMNPPTVGHLALVNKMLQISQQKQAKPLIFLSHSVDSKKNPLSYNDKAKLINMAFGRIVQKSNAKNIFDMLKELSGNYENLVIVVGSDRVKDLKRISTTYNGKDFNFKNIEVVSAGTRDPDSDGVTGMSATKMRDAAAKNDIQAFKRGLPNQLNKYAEKILKMVREGMNLKEDLDNIFEQHLDEAGVLTVAGRRKKAIAARRYKARLKVARRRVARRLAQTGRIKKRTARAAIRVMRNRLAGSRGKSYSKLSPIEKSSIDKRVRQRSNIVQKLATRIMPVTRRKEFARFKSFRTRKEAMDMAFSSYLTENNHKEVKPIQEKVLNNLIKKSISAEIPVNILSEVYNKYRSKGDTFAFNRLNEFINKNRTSDMDQVFEAFIAELSTNTLISYRDKAIKDASRKHRDAQRAYDGGNYNRADVKLKSAQKRVASMNTATDKIQDKMQKKKKTLIGKPVSETKEAPKGFHFTRSGKLKKGDAGQDGDGGKMLRSDPLDKQRSKVPPVSEEVNKKDTKGLKNLSDMLKGSSKAHLKQKKDLDKLIQNEAKEQQMQEIAQDSTINHMLTPAKNVKVVKKNVALEGKKPGLWDNIHAKRKRIKSGSKERMRTPGSKGAPTAQDFKDAAEGYISELDTDTIKSAHDKRKKQEFDASYKADSYQSDAERASTKQSEKNKRGLRDQQRKIADKASRGKALANRALKRKGYKMGGASDYRLHPNNYDDRRKDEKSGRLKEEGGAGLIGTDSLLKRYIMDTPGQTPSRDLAIDGVPGKGGMIQKQEPLKGLGQSGKQKVQSYKDYLNAKKS